MLSMLHLRFNCGSPTTGYGITMNHRPWGKNLSLFKNQNRRIMLHHGKLHFYYGTATFHPSYLCFTKVHYTIQGFSKRNRTNNQMLVMPL